MKKRISILLVLIFLSTFITGCLANEGSPNGDKANTSSFNDDNLFNSKDDTSLDPPETWNGPDYFDEPYEDRIYDAFQYVNEIVRIKIWDNDYAKKFDLDLNESRLAYLEYAEKFGYTVRDENNNEYFNYDDSNRPEVVTAYVELNNKFRDATLACFESTLSNESSNTIYSAEGFDTCFYLYRAIRYHSITREEFEAWDDFIKSVNPENPNWPISKTEIALLYSDNFQALRKSFLNPWSVIAGDKIYTARWLSEHSSDDYEAAGITVDMVQKSYDEAKSFFTVYEPALTDLETKLNAYIQKIAG